MTWNTKVLSDCNTAPLFSISNIRKDLTKNCPNWSNSGSSDTWGILFTFGFNGSSDYPYQFCLAIFSLAIWRRKKDGPNQEWGEWTVLPSSG